MMRSLLTGNDLELSIVMHHSLGWTNYVKKSIRGFENKKN